MRNAARSSPPAVFRNLRRAGVLKNRSCTSTVVPGERATAPRPATRPPSTSTNAAASAPAGRETSRRRLTAAMLGSASPRKPSVASRSRSSIVPSLLVACRSSASSSSSAAMPAPSSATVKPWSSERSTRTSTRCAPASSAFSSTSFRAESGRSMTSPAAMRDAVASGSRRMGRDTRPPVEGAHSAPHRPAGSSGPRAGGG